MKAESYFSYTNEKIVKRLKTIKIAVFANELLSLDELHKSSSQSSHTMSVPLLNLKLSQKSE